MFYTIELLRAVDALHSVGILHGDLKLDNVLLRNDVSAEETAAQAAWNAPGSHGWDCKGSPVVLL
jgi:checkpoint serine/threonine-protein kinase